MSNVKFTPVRGTEANIAAHIMGFNNGYVYFATDTGNIYIDYVDENGTNVVRKPMGSATGGGSSSGIFYANREVTDAEKLETELIFPMKTIEGDVYPSKDDLLFNSKDSSFYRIIAVNPIVSAVTGLRLTVAGGSGGGSVGLAEDIDLYLEPLPTVNLINGHSQLIYFTAHSAKNAKGNPIDNTLTITWTLAYTEDGNNYTSYKTDKFTVKTGELSYFDFGKYAKNSSSLKLTLKASQANASGTITRSVEFSTSALSLSLPSGFTNLTYFNCSNVTLQCKAVGEMDKILEYYFDNEEIPFFTETLSEADTVDRSVQVQKYLPITNGTHEVWIRLYQSINGEKGIEVEPLHFEIAAWDGVSKNAIIWLGDYKKSYYSYDTIQIPFRVYDPNSVDKAIVHFKRNNIELSNSPQTITDMANYSYFEIADAELDVINHYSISCGEGDYETSRKIEITVTQDPTRTDFGIQKQEFLTYEINTIGSGRSNSESVSKRQTLEYKNGDEIISASFNNFNWYNNGWVRDEENKTCLRISNGASLSIPLGAMTFADPSGNSSTDLSHSIDICFKIRNVQDYSNLIRNVTRYKNDTVLYNEFYDETSGTYKTSYTNYDSFLAWYLKTHEVSDGEGGRLGYDDLEFDYIQKQINLNNVVCGYYSGDTKSVVGLCLGPQDAFFSNGTDTVSISYVENQMITLSAVYQYSTVPSQNLMYIYLNGILTGVIKSTAGVFKIDSDNMIFNSEYCDIDIYKVRVYRTPLTVNDIVMNYAADFEDIDIYDQNKLAEENRSINEYQFSYANMIKYNESHPQSPLMPYIIFDTSKTGNGDKLSYAKSVDLDIGVEFVNTPLELAYTSGELEDLAKQDGLWKDGDTAAEKAAAVKKYYQYHCPSWIGDHVNMAVQGTSSEFYPRRNYKLKTKTDYDDDKEERIHIFLNRGPFAEDYAADMAGIKMSKFIISDDPYDKDKVYYTDKAGENQITFDANTPYEYGKYYVENSSYVEFGDESTRQKYFYYNNYIAGTTKFTMKIDFMESSGSYNMGFANLVHNAYSKHPLDDYNAAGAFVIEDPSKSSYVIADEFEEGETYFYKNHKGNWKNTKDDELKITTAEEFAMGPIAYASSIGVSKVLNEANMSTAISESGMTEAELREYMNNWYVAAIGYSDYTIPETSAYRTSVQGFRVLAFHKKSDGTYQYIGMYNMLLDKGSDEAYGFKLDKTAPKSPLMKYLKKKKASKKAECWEFQNNNRTFCSFRDPLQRKELSFDVFTYDNTGKKVRTLNSVRSAPVVADSFEYRYHTDSDIIDYIFDPIKEGDKYYSEDCQEYMKENNVEFNFNKDNPSENEDDRAEFLLDRYGNWEKAVKWVWSTCTEVVPSQGSYELANVGKTVWVANTFYLYDEATGTYILDSNDAYIPNTTYYSIALDDNGNPITYTDEDGNVIYQYTNAFVSNLIYAANTYYIEVDGSKVLSTSATFDESADYYILNDYSDEELSKIADRLVQVCEDPSFTIGKEYYTYDAQKKACEAVELVEVTADTYEPGKYYEGIEIIYGKKTYKFDTQEYRADKFVNELSKHFDLEYLATYFIMTEVFECYDSRGKNAMFASWGPQEEGGDYIWYPLFYDIDTQLGINNTGIPSFEYNVDATEDGNYSTSDSVLWNNFYKYFKTAEILMKYKHLRGVTAGVKWPALKYPPLATVDRIESWYRTDPDECKNIAMRGERPMIAINLDEYYKYITITNSASYENGVTGHIQSDTSGAYTYDPNGTYFYALQGDRSLSRRQFLTNRLEYIDSWLNQGNYQRGGANRIRGRVAANNATKTSDKWVETDAAPYYKEDGTKSHLFDAEYWITLTPSHSSYVTLGDDAEAYPSRKYDGINPLKFEISAIEPGVRKSNNYPEQLLYIYGINQMKDLGDMSNLYWQEFEISGDASKLVSLKLGSDYTDPVDGVKWRNDKVNQPSIPAGKDASGMPLLKEVNMCNMQINTGTPVLDLTSCEKLENFRATGSNYTNIRFAEGVALNTAYLPVSVTALELTEARLLRNLVTNYIGPTRDKEGNLHIAPGLYLEGMFESNTTNITTLSIIGGSLGYDSYTLLKKYYDIRSSQTANKCNVQLTNVEWSPYVQVAADDIYDDEAIYYKDNGHYGLVEYEYNVMTWPVSIANGEIYKLNTAIAAETINQISDISMFEWMMRDDTHFVKNNNNNIPEISGIIYVNNTTAVDEYYIRNTVQPKYPDLKFFFASVNKAYTARFLLMDADEGEDGLYTLVGSQTIKEGWFANPVDTYGDISKLKPNHDFYGWALKNSLEADIIVNLNKTIDKWSNQALVTNQYDYTFYAVCPIHSWNVTYYDHLGTVIETKKIPHETYAGISNTIPWKDDSALAIEETYKFLGFARSANSSTIIDLNTYVITEDTSFYAVFDENPVSVFENVNPDYFSVSLFYPNVTTYNDGGYGGNDTRYNITDGVILSLAKEVTGKLTVPAFFNGKPVFGIDASFGANSLKKAAESVMGISLTDCKGDKLTHVFFEKVEGDIPTNIRVIKEKAFYLTNTIVYVEFPQGLRAIESKAFFADSGFDVPSPQFINNEITGTICQLGSQCFNNAFHKSVTNLVLGGDIQIMAQINSTSASAATIFQGDTSIFFGAENITKINKIEIGSAENPCEVSLSLDKPAIASFAEANTELIFYSTRYNNPSDLYTAFPNITITSLVNG